MKRSFAACLLIATTACQSYSAVALNAVPVGADVRVDLTDSGSNTALPGVGSRAQQLEGKVTRVDSSGLALVISELMRIGGATELGEGRTVSVPAEAIATVRVQSLSASRSLLVAGAVVVGSVLVGRSLGNGSGSAMKGGGPPQTGH